MIPLTVHADAPESGDRTEPDADLVGQETEQNLNGFERKEHSSVPWSQNDRTIIPRCTKLSGMAALLVGSAPRWFVALQYWSTPLSTVIVGPADDLLLRVSLCYRYALAMPTETVHGTHAL